MVLKKFLDRFKNRNETFKKIQEEDRVHRVIEERKKNSNEREVERFREMDRQRALKKELDSYRQRERDELWRGKNVLNAPNVIRSKNIFAGNENTVMKGEGMFFK